IAAMRKEAAKRGLDPNLWFNNVEQVTAEKLGMATTAYVRNIYKYDTAYKLIAESQSTAQKYRLKDRAPRASREGSWPRHGPGPGIEAAGAGDASNRVLSHLWIVGRDQAAQALGRFAAVDQRPHERLAHLFARLAGHGGAQGRQRRLVLDLAECPGRGQPHPGFPIVERRDQSLRRRVDMHLAQRPRG